MQFDAKIEGVEVDDTQRVEDLELICVSKEKHQSVDLCFRAREWNIPFASIKLYDTNRFIDARNTFHCASFLGTEIASRWNLFRNIAQKNTKYSVLRNDNRDNTNEKYIILRIDNGSKTSQQAKDSAMLFINSIKEINPKMYDEMIRFMKEVASNINE